MKGVSSSFQWRGEDGIGSKVIQNQDVFVAGAGCERETAGKVGLRLVGAEVDNDGKDLIGWGWVGRWEQIFVCVIGLGALDILADLV